MDGAAEEVYEINIPGEDAADVSPTIHFWWDKILVAIEELPVPSVRRMAEHLPGLYKTYIDGLAQIAKSVWNFGAKNSGGK